jgi:hypothetical protein
MNDRQIAFVPFIDSAIRPVFLDEDGRQYVLDDDGQPVYGMWVYIDEPEIVEAGPTS